MKKIFYAAVVGLILFEVANVYFIMPMPGGSQTIESIGLAYFLYRFRWAFRIGLGALAVFSYLKTPWKRRWIPLSILAIFAALTYVFNFQMAADTMFLQQNQVVTKPADDSKVRFSLGELGQQLFESRNSLLRLGRGRHGQISLRKPEGARCSKAAECRNAVPAARPP